MNKPRKYTSLFKNYQSFSLYEYSEKHPKIYLISVLITALVGYGITLLFPLVTIAGIVGLENTFNSINGSLADKLPQLIISSSLIIIGTALSYHLFILKFEPRAGISIPKQFAPKLYSLVEEDNKGPFATPIHDIQVIDLFDLKVLKYPVCGLPVYSRNVLLIGFDFMQAMPKEYFDCAVTAKLAQHAKRNFRLTHWLSEIAFIWSLYPKALRKRNHVGDNVLAGIIGSYSRFYNWISKAISLHSNAIGDSYALRNYNDETVLEGIETQAAAELILINNFFPEVKKRQEQNSLKGTAPLNPYTAMPGIFTKLVSSKSAAPILNSLKSATTPAPYSIFPPIKNRLEHIGHTDTIPLKPWRGNAGSYYFEDNYKTVVAQMGKRWNARHNLQHKSSARKPVRRSPKTSTVTAKI